jgi:hypothetical protein
MRIRSRELSTRVKSVRMNRRGTARGNECCLHLDIVQRTLRMRRKNLLSIVKNSSTRFGKSKSLGYRPSLLDSFGITSLLKFIGEVRLFAICATQINPFQFQSVTQFPNQEMKFSNKEVYLPSNIIFQNQFQIRRVSVQDASQNC